MITEYYKFHRDVPLIFDKPLERILGKYYSKVRENDYKQIKRVLKD